MPFEETEKDPNKAHKDEDKVLGHKKIRDQDDWMQLCRPHNSSDDFDEDNTRDSEFNEGDLSHYNWSGKLTQFPPLSEAPKFVTEAPKFVTEARKIALYLKGARFGCRFEPSSRQSEISVQHCSQPQRVDKKRLRMQAASNDSLPFRWNRKVISN